MTLTGSVSRWFNRKGFGFINVVSSDSEQVGTDIFVHLSGINVSNDGYKCLYPGEYVSFDLDKNDKGQFVCVNVTGVGGGSLLIEHPEYRYKYFQRNPMQRDNDNSSGSSRAPISTGSTEASSTGAQDSSSATATEPSVSTTEVSTTEVTTEVDENDPEQA